MEISAKILCEAAISWSDADKQILKKRIGSKERVNILDVYKLFMPSHFMRTLIADGQHELAKRWLDFRHDEETLDKTKNDFSHEVYVGLEDKSLKAVLRG